jgi:hypothetical protein
MKKIVFTLSAIVLASSYFFGQCKVEISTPNPKICSNESAILTSKPFSLTSVPNILDSSEIINLSKVKEITPQVVTIINSVGGSGLSLPIPNFSKETAVNLPGIKLVNTNVTSGSINIKSRFNNRF